MSEDKKDNPFEVKQMGPIKEEQITTIYSDDASGDWGVTFRIDNDRVLSFSTIEGTVDEDDDNWVMIPWERWYELVARVEENHKKFFPNSPALIKKEPPR